jgi:hypothetical protein
MANGAVTRGARAEQHPPRHGEVESAHQPFSPGKTAGQRVEAGGGAARLAGMRDTVAVTTRP